MDSPAKTFLPGFNDTYPLIGVIFDSLYYALDLRSPFRDLW